MEELSGRGSRRPSRGADEREGKGAAEKGGGGRDREEKIREKGGRDSREGGVFLRVLEVTA